jgi:dipeptidyl aminopeptidase/acylaminoacyl peptidase
VIAGAYDEAHDIESAIDYIRSCPFVDSRRVAIGGHSVGGLMTVIAAARRPDLAAAVSIDGGITWIFDGVQEGYPAIRQVWDTEAPRIKVPILLLQGDRDAVVAPELSRYLAERLQERSAPVTLKLYPGDHYSFPIEEIASFLDEQGPAR